MKNPSRTLLFKGGVFLTSLSVVASFLLMEKKTKNKPMKFPKCFAPLAAAEAGTVMFPALVLLVI